MNQQGLIIDLNADLGEGFPYDGKLMEVVTSASISCGAHAGDETTIIDALKAAKEHGVVVGAHPGYPDREGFGRREQNLGLEAVKALILDQWRGLQSLAEVLGLPLRFLKPHGALYNQAQVDPEIASGIVQAVGSLKVPLLGQPRSQLETLARAEGVRYISEGFPDRGYRDDGRLLPRHEPHAVLEDPGEVAAQAERLVTMGFETLCIHGDSPRALENARVIRERLSRLGYVFRSFV